jgi:hypothetical protein
MVFNFGAEYRLGLTPEGSVYDQRDQDWFSVYTTTGFGTLSGAICVQVIDDAADRRAEWRECANPACRNPFKYQRRNSTDSIKLPRNTTTYCTPQCKQQHADIKRGRTTLRE